ncbi:substrate-binding domain-containing protein [Halobacillus shinanisalinarum]|uniref:Substrate-binding domain-containing protein n=1 Tax=Halobacillus shinanisalinarum TaxID=2932258 RepID=A0ABY4H3B5_9BACI|nr:substrate-binding domain-containing protein [Halobacillus shinanisalinarum]UOQ94819.1 substrate-binding domain-containing protein [Halobacillus shinanisalinarum]
MNDGLSYLVTSGLQAQGFKVPNDASVCGFDNGQLSQLSTPSIITMDIDFKAFGQNAVEKLFSRMGNPEAPHQEVLLPAKLIERESTQKNGTRNKIKQQ